MADEDLKMHSLYLFQGDYEKMQSLYPDLGAAIVIRNLVRDHIQRNFVPPDVSKIKVQVKL